MSRLPFGMRLGFLLTCLCLPAVSSCSYITTTFFTIIEVLAADSGLPLESPAVAVSTIRWGRVRSFGDGPAPAGPVNDAGHLTVPITVIGTDPFDGLLRLNVAVEGREKRIVVANKERATVSQNNVRIRVLSVDGDPPPPPALAPVLGSSPAQIEVHGFANSVSVCDHATGQEWHMTTGLAYRYVDIVTVGEALDSFSVFEYAECYPDDPVAGADFTVIVQSPSSEYNGTTVRTGLCLTDGVVTPCPVSEQRPRPSQ